MAVSNSKLVCPDCKAVLKPARPLPAGRPVKCPKCGSTFTTPGGKADEEEEAPRKAKAPARDREASERTKPTAKKAAGAAKKPAAVTRKPEVPAPPAARKVQD